MLELAFHCPAGPLYSIHQVVSMAFLYEALVLLSSDFALDSWICCSVGLAGSQVIHTQPVMDQGLLKFLHGYVILLQCWCCSRPSIDLLVCLYITIITTCWCKFEHGIGISLFECFCSIAMLVANQLIWHVDLLWQCNNKNWLRITWMPDMMNLEWYAAPNSNLANVPIAGKAFPFLGFTCCTTEFAFSG